MPDQEDSSENGGLFRVTPVEGQEGVFRIVPVEEDASLMGKGDSSWATSSEGLFRVAPVEGEASASPSDAD